MSYRVGVDIGGTFTDMLVTDESGGGAALQVADHPTGPVDRPR